MFNFIKESDMPQELKDAIADIEKLMSKSSVKDEAFRDFKTGMATVMGKAIDQDELEPYLVITAMLSLAAITSNVYMDQSKVEDPRKLFRKMAGLAWDRAKTIEAMVDGKEKK